MIKTTTDYDIFNLTKINVPIKPEHVEKLKKSIQFKNLLHLRPILVNKKMEVIDGQHRLKAAMSLGVPIYYEIEADLEDHDMLLLNANSRSWSLLEYLHHYCERGYKEYLRLRNFIEDQGISLGMGLTLCGLRGGESSQNFRNGTLEFVPHQKYEEILDNLEKVEECISFIRKAHVHFVHFVNEQRFRIALFNFIKNPEVDYSLFIKKLEMLGEKVKKCADAPGYTVLFQRIYNWRNQNPISIYNED